MSISEEKGRLLNKYQNYSLFEVFTDNGLKYYMCLPNEETFDIQMAIDFPEENDEDRKIAGLENVCNTLYDYRVNYAYLLTGVSTSDVTLASLENDDHAYGILRDELCKYTSHATKIIMEDVAAKMLPVVGIIVQTDNDKKFMDWLDIEYPDLFKKIDLSNLVKINYKVTDDDGWTTRGGPSNGGDGLEVTNNLSKPKTKKLTLPSGKHGYLNITFAIVVIALAFAIGIGLAVILMK